MESACGGVMERRVRTPDLPHSISQSLAKPLAASIPTRE